ncbi:SRPBCC family protein [Kangiella shandongensis]|uniref:SRPBCC family protein n=1 Tax=Kangiella shandongensis TaxID=2763258 RepID=UPI001CBC91A8|nr:SRPBCC family protein [Kangiella shandongensis]
MMKILKSLLLIIAAIAIVLIVVGLFLPQKAHVERSITVDAPRDAVFQQVNTFKDYNSWSPWYQRDPNAKYEFTGPESGVGAKMAWESDNSQVGNGSQEIVESDYPSHVKTKLLFGEDPNPGYAVFTLEEIDVQKTKLTWSFDADFGYNIMGRYFGVFMDDMLGPDYEKGLQSLKQKIEN